MSQRVHYHPTTDIPDDHWALKSPKEFTVAEVEIDNASVLVKVNPTDKRGYRIIVQLLSADMKSTLNRPWTCREMNAVFRVGTVIANIYQEKGLLPQIVFAGNNAMETSPDGKTVIVGKREPAMMHIHIFGRGISGISYFSKIPLICPAIGKEFNLKGDGDPNLGEKKVPWTQEESTLFKESLSDLLLTHQERDNIKIIK